MSEPQPSAAPETLPAEELSRRAVDLLAELQGALSGWTPTQEGVGHDGLHQVTYKAGNGQGLEYDGWLGFSTAEDRAGGGRPVAGMIRRVYLSGSGDAEDFCQAAVGGDGQEPYVAGYTQTVQAPRGTPEPVPNTETACDSAAKLVSEIPRQMPGGNQTS